MMATIITLLKMVLLCLPFVIICLLNMKLNKKKEERYKQVFLPVVALLYCIIGMLLLNKLSTWILTFLYWLPEKFSFLSFLENINWAFGLTFIVNIVLIVGFIIIKWLLMPFLPSLLEIEAIEKVTSGLFYYRLDNKKDRENHGNYFIKEKFGDARKLLRNIYIVSIILFAILLVITYYFTSKEVFSSPFYPAFGIIILGEIVFFLSGMTYVEKKEEKEIPEEEPNEEIEYDTLVEEYQDTFPSRLIQAEKDRATPKMDESVADLLDKYREEYENTMNQEANLMYHYYGALEANGEVLDEGYLHQTKNILDGKSVLFFTQFYDDTTPYVFLPVVRHLMRRKKILVVLGRSNGEENIRDWFRRGIYQVNNFEGIWKIDTLANADDDTSVAILESKNIYNQKLLTSKADFLANTTMVFIIEPNYLLGTLQIGLSTLVSYLKNKENDPQYIIYDRNCDGLVDSLSHVLNKSIVQVNATSVGTAKKNMLFWQADGKILHHKLGLTSSRYLGVGIELALVALRKGVSKVIWASSAKFPVVDMRWIASQYYANLCYIAKMKISQNELAEHMVFTEDLSSLCKETNSFMVVEDEFNNAFEVIRQFSTRGVKQSFINVLSSDYWLRSYMIDNVEIFKNDPKSIPSFAPDYQRSINNMMYKLIIRLIEGQVEESEIREMFDLMGEDCTNVYNSLRALIMKYFFRFDENDEEERGRVTARLDDAIQIKNLTVVNQKTMRAERKRFYSINNKTFVDNFLSQLKIVYYIAEDEKDKSHHLESAMYGHVHQKYLPGMLVTLEGKYYEIISMTKNSGVVVRRAADHIDRRHYYRPLRKYTVNYHEDAKTATSNYSYGNITFEHSEANIVVDTFGYLDMNDYGDIKNAKKVLINNIDSREYINKEVIRIRFANSTPEIRSTIAILLNELFVTAFPENYPYIVAATKYSAEETPAGLLPEVDGIDDECIYIIEDSLIDLGLLINVDRYFLRFMEIICDALNWHKVKLTEEEKADSESENSDDEPADDESADDEEDMSLSNKTIFRNSSEIDDTGITGDDSESISILGGSTDDDEPKPYSESFYLLYGFEEVPACVDIDATSDYLNEQGFEDNYLKQARENNNFKKLKWYNYHFEPGVHYCDFCGAPMEDNFDVLDDGRERCPECSKSSIKKLKDFKKLYKKTRKEMEEIFNIKLKTKINIKTCNAKKIAEEMGESFVPTPSFDGRTVGFAIRGGNGDDIYIENGAPEIESAKTLVHEMTHLWQYENMPDLFEKSKDLIACEGMAVWAEAQYLTSRGMNDRAMAYIMCRLSQNNEYGNGLRKYLDKYPIKQNPFVHKGTPFNKTSNPLK